MQPDQEIKQLEVWRCAQTMDGRARRQYKAEGAGNTRTPARNEY